MKPPYGHMGCRENLIGENPDAALIDSLSNETMVTPDTPPTFLFQTDSDDCVLAENSVVFYLALRKAGVPAEMHIYQTGPHGVGMAPENPILSQWPIQLRLWLQSK
jgi:acetyl esterase/lipase